ncbi:MAG: hypothetical protein A2Z20_11955 [Bdellovibrionales bacterium RBG_16_40_8]|nr:MAG: hypothetical protein A2Z20_11955 [Bdellovibrionales bacterium RBG_16_40_8]
MNKDEKNVEQKLIDDGLLSTKDLHTAKLKALNKNLSLTQVLLSDAFVTDLALAKIFSECSKLDLIDLTNMSLEQEILNLIPEATVKKNNVLPIQMQDGSLIVAIKDPDDIIHLEKISAAVNRPFIYKIAVAGQLTDAIKRIYSPALGIEVGANVEKTTGGTRKIIFNESSKIVIEEVINQLIENCALFRASDIHIEPEDKILRVRARIDGILHEVSTLKIEHHAQVISRLKILAGLDIAEKRNAQDGSFQYNYMKKVIDLRLSTLPTVRGEKAVLRILDKTILQVSIDDLGFTAAMLESVKRILDMPHGLILITGPTGSGKTTTVYSMLNHINSIEKNIITVEDPVEYQLGIINQVQVNVKAGLTFANILRNILRQDPDIVMIGEMRDKETADLAIRAALTGHLVISTIHTNDSINTVTRLIDMGIEPFMVASSLAAVMSQRLVRVLCASCKKKNHIASTELVAISPAFANLQEAIIYEPVGCDQCYGYGYRGRQPIFELMVPTPQIRKAISLNKTTDELANMLSSGGFQTMRIDGIARVLAGVTSIDEIIKETI